MNLPSANDRINKEDFTAGFVLGLAVGAVGMGLIIWFVLYLILK